MYGSEKSYRRKTEKNDDDGANNKPNEQNERLEHFSCSKHIKTINRDYKKPNRARKLYQQSTDVAKKIEKLTFSL